MRVIEHCSIWIHCSKSGTIVSFTQTHMQTYHINTSIYHSESHLSGKVCYWNTPQRLFFSLLIMNHKKWARYSMTNTRPWEIESIKRKKEYVIIGFESWLKILMIERNHKKNLYQTSYRINTFLLLNFSTENREINSKWRHSWKPHMHFTDDI